jgi:glutaredoxin 2
MTNTAASVKAHEFPAVKRSEYKAELRNTEKAQALKNAQDNVVSYEKTVNEATDVKRKLQALHLSVAGQYGATSVQSAISSIEEELRYQDRYLKSAQQALARLTGDVPADDEAEF